MRREPLLVCSRHHLVDVSLYISVKGCVAHVQAGSQTEVAEPVCHAVCLLTSEVSPFFVHQLCVSPRSATIFTNAPAHALKICPVASSSSLLVVNALRALESHLHKDEKKRQLTASDGKQILQARQSWLGPYHQPNYTKRHERLR